MFHFYTPFLFAFGSQVKSFKSVFTKALSETCAILSSQK